MKQIFLLSLLYLLSFLNLPLACAQDETALDFERFLEMVKVSHPISRQADIMLEQGDANFRQARGGFDPKLMSTYDYKQYDGKEYYRINNNELKWPTSIAGIALKAGYENNEGTFLNPENNVPGNGLAYAGIAVPLGAGMFSTKGGRRCGRQRFFSSPQTWSAHS
ncbi:MAG: hypothetical protein HC819_05400 [Cyclobacteriaceae bacterium]|nr:hypothetical protein [Cyclobacteriaceae bacterium]